MRVNVKRARDIKTRAREAQNFSIFSRPGLRAADRGPSAQDAGDGALALGSGARKQMDLYVYAGQQLDCFARIDSSPARSDAGGASKGVIAMAQDAIFVLAAIATIVGAAAAVGSLALSVALLLPRGKTRADDQEGKKNGR